MRSKHNKSNLFILVGSVILVVSYYLYPTIYQPFSYFLFQSVYQYNASHVQQIKQPTPAPEGYTTLSVIARPPQVPYDTLLAIPIAALPLDIQIQVGTYVFNSDELPVGYISEIQNEVHTVALFSSPTAKEQFSIAETVFTGEGLGGGGIQLTTPILPSINTAVPVLHQATGRAIGVTELIEKNKGEDSQKVFFTLPSNPFELHQVYVLATDSVVSEIPTERL